MFSVLFLGLQLWQTRSLVPKGELAPALPAPGAASDRPTLVYFFAPWCSVCKVSASNLATLRRWLGSDRIATLAVALDYEDTESVEAFVAENGVPAPVVLGDEALRDAFHVTGYPTYYVLSADGRIAAQSIGYSSLPGMFMRWAWVWLSS